MSDLEKRVRQLEELLDASANLSSSLDVRITLGTIGALCHSLLGADASSIMILDARREVLCFEIVSGEVSQRLRGLEVAVGEGVAGRVARSGMPVLVKDCQAEKVHATRFDEVTGFVTRSMLCVPLIARGKVVGVMEALNKEGGFTPDDLELAMSIGTMAAAAVLNGQLHEEVKQQQAQTVQAAKLAALGTIASGITHELSQPLTGILGFVQLLERQLKIGTFEKEVALEHLGFIEKQVQRMNQIIQHVRTFARAQPVKGEVAVNGVVRDAVTLMQRQLEAQGIDLQLKLSEEIPTIPGDSGRLEEVIINLLANARDAILSHRGENREIRVTTSMADFRDAPHVAIEVEDTGGGIAADVLPRIFEPFYTTRPTGQGTGLGLSISHGIVRDHGGAIEVESRLGEGTRFYVYLPRSREEPSHG